MGDMIENDLHKEQIKLSQQFLNNTTETERDKLFKQIRQIQKIKKHWNKPK